MTPAIYDNSEGSLELWLATVREIIGKPLSTLACLDLCCNEMTGTRHLDFKHITGVDLVDWPTRPIRFPFVPIDALDYCEGALPKEWDVAICSDGIEHFTKDRGALLISEATRVAELAIFFTPLGPYMLDETATLPDAHKSAWMPEDFPPDWKFRIFPNWHPTMKLGAFFAWKGAV